MGTIFFIKLSLPIPNGNYITAVEITPPGVGGSHKVWIVP